MIWIGGTQGSGKSTIARSLAVAYDLPFHRIDLFTYDHVERMGSEASLDEDLARGTSHAADAFQATSRARLDLVRHDVAQRGLGDVPAVVEGPQLDPAGAGQLPPGSAVWLLASATRTLLVRRQRLAVAEDPAGRARLEKLTHRDELLTIRVRQSAAETGRPVIDVSDEPDWPAVAAQVESALAPSLSAAPRLRSGDQLRGQRRYENRIACRQGRRWQAAIGLATLPPYPFACECGRSRCGGTWSGTPDEYDRETAAGVRATEHR